MKRKPLDPSTLQMSLFMFGGIFNALNWIEMDVISMPDDEVANVRAGLILAGAELAKQLKDRL